MPAETKTITAPVEGYTCDGVGCTEWAASPKDAGWIKIVFQGRKGREDSNKVSETLWFHNRACARTYAWRDLVKDVFDVL